MTVFWVNLVSVYILSLIARIKSKPKNTIDVFSQQPNRVYVLIVLTILVLISGLRSNIGDTIYYMDTYRLKNFTWNDIHFDGDFGFIILQFLLQKVSNDPQVLIFVTSLVINVLIIYTIYKYSTVFELGVFLYITTGAYLVSMNGIRQYLAASLIFAATKYILEGNWKKYTIMVLIASTFHQSALVLIPIYFIVRRKAWSLNTGILLFIGLLITYYFGEFSSLLFKALEGTQYGLYSQFNEGGANILRSAVQLAPVVIAFLGRKTLKRIWDKSDYIVNLSILNFVISFIATQNWIVARLSIYFSLYNLILVPLLIFTFIKKDRNIVYFAILVCYFLYYFYEMVITWGTVYRSNFF